MRPRTRLDRYYLAPFQREIDAFFARSRGGRALELGCGDGRHTDGLRALGFTAIGLDLDAPRVAQARRAQPACAFVRGDAARLPFASASFDVIFSCSVLQYVDRARLLGECWRVLRPGGRMLLLENLRGHPLARLHRRVLRGARTALPAHRVPRDHVALGELDWSAHGFAITGTRAANLFAPLALARGAARLEPLLFALDRRLLARAPRLAAYCWTVLVTAERRACPPR